MAYYRANRSTNKNSGNGLRCAVKLHVFGHFAVGVNPDVLYLTSVSLRHLHALDTSASRHSENDCETCNLRDLALH
jgi:hypothetical protein